MRLLEELTVVFSPWRGGEHGVRGERGALSPLVLEHGPTAGGQIARDALGLTFAYVDEFEAAAQRLINETMSEAQYVAMTRRLFGTPDPDASTRAQNAERERTATLAHLWHDGSTLDGIRGTAWDILQPA